MPNGIVECGRSRAVTPDPSACVTAALLPELCLGSAAASSARAGVDRILAGVAADVSHDRSAEARALTSPIGPRQISAQHLVRLRRRRRLHPMCDGRLPQSFPIGAGSVSPRAHAAGRFWGLRR